ncbi:uncharacterized protein LOC124442331 isoform X1 [Xenia sp. Carnegie-2017]|uniref:uncharacterized protein LOC124442331 isoform X1 n=1 Tax=Xenia sp. Carnegie-2017 TaxID=2897299 RepID=UPI001F04CB6C|nr:uncharacterized protein LOC124442331 isoform X1 [Xenia sp. Carnegie-2017]
MSSHEFVEDDGTREIDFLYGDLEVDINKQVSYEELKEKSQKQETMIGKLQKENQQLKLMNEVLKNNISSLFLTAQNEIARKDAEIKRLQDVEVRNRTRLNRMNSTHNSDML